MMIRKTLIILTAILSLIVTDAFAYRTVTVNDRGAIRTDLGCVRRVDRPDVARAAVTLFGRGHIPFVHGVVPAGPLSAMVIEDVRFERNDHSCYAPETLAGRLELAFSFSLSGVDSIEDLYTDAIAVCPVIVPPTGQNSRTFFSAFGRPQGNGLDEFIAGFQAIGAGNPFVIRFIPEPQVGLDVDLSHVIIKTGGNPDTETGLLDEGNLSLMYLGTKADSVTQRAFTGLLIYVPYEREPFTSGRVQLDMVYNDYMAAYRSFWPIFADEDAVTGCMVWGLTRWDLDEIPYKEPVFYSPEGTCRVANIVIKYQP